MYIKSRGPAMIWLVREYRRLLRDKTINPVLKWPRIVGHSDSDMGL